MYTPGNMKIVKDEFGKYGVESWTTGFHRRREPTLDEEASRNPEAVFYRLVRNEKWDLAEYVMDQYIK